MKNVVVDTWHKNGAFIIGDAAHQYPPSGGYGLNTGVSDAFSLAWRLKYFLKLSKEAEKVLKKNFELERGAHAKFISISAKHNYEKFINSCKALGLNIQYCNILENFVKYAIPKFIQKNLFESLMSFGISINHQL